MDRINGPRVILGGLPTGAPMENPKNGESLSTPRVGGFRRPGHFVFRFWNPLAAGPVIRPNTLGLVEQR